MMQFTKLRQCMGGRGGGVIFPIFLGQLFSSAWERVLRIGQPCHRLVVVNLKVNYTRLGGYKQMRHKSSLFSNVHTYHQI